ncbi:MAG: hypothetical protein M4579_004360 [Chaenotheca gracillima]|nr:MAG: hypothetical protein M4579_004360 [Chaenotheca gracillima]
MSGKQQDSEYNATVKNADWGVKGDAKALQQLSSSDQAAKDKRDGLRTERAKTSLLDAAKELADHEKSGQKANQK